MDVKTTSDGHDGSLCLLRKRNAVERHFAGEVKELIILNTVMYVRWSVEYFLMQVRIYLTLQLVKYGGRFASSNFSCSTFIL